MSTPTCSTCCNKTRTIVLSAIIGGALGALASVPVQKLMGPKAAVAAAPATQPATQPAPKVDEAVREVIKEEIKAQLKEQQKEVAARVAAVKQVSEMEAKASSVRSAIMTLRSQIALYKLQHQDNAPTLAQLNDNWSALTKKTDATGKVITGPGGFGPYMQSGPVNALNGKTKVAAKGKPVTADAGWVYEESSSRIWAVVPENLEAQVKTAMNGDYVVGPAIKK